MNRPVAIFAIAAFALLVLVALPAWFLFAAQADDMAENAKQLATFQSEIADRPRLEAELAILKQSNVSSAFIGGENAEIAAANLQSTVKAQVERFGGQVHSAQNLPPTTAGRLEKVAVRADMSVRPDRLADTLYRLETSQPFLFLDDVDITMPELWLTEGAPDQPSNLNVHLTVQAYRRADTP